MDASHFPSSFANAYAICRWTSFGTSPSFTPNTLGRRDVRGAEHHVPLRQHVLDVPERRPLRPVLGFVRCELRGAIRPGRRYAASPPGR